MNQNYYDPNLCYNSNSSGFDQYQPPQYSVTHQPPQEKSMAELLLEEKLPQALQALCEKLNKYVQEKQEEKNVAKEQAAKVSSKYWKPPIYYNDDDDDDEYSIQVSEFYKNSPITIAPDLPITDSLIMEDEHLNTILEMESDKENESSVKDLNLTPSESEDLFEDLSDYKSECDVPIFDDSSSKNEGLDDIVSIPPGKEIDHLDVIPDSVESLLNHANSIIFLIEEFVGELAPIDPIPPGINLILRFLMILSNDSLMEEINIFLPPDESIPPGVENDDYHSEGDNFPSSPRPPEKPPDDDGIYFDIEPDTGVLTTKVVDNISDNSKRELYVHIPNVFPTLPTLYPVFDTLLPFSSENKDKVFNPGILISNEDKSPHFLPHRGFKAF
ncbi:hypothetical protein Tco_0605834 [Tanacetum coccineum]